MAFPFPAVHGVFRLRRWHPSRAPVPTRGRESAVAVARPARGGSEDASTGIAEAYGSARDTAATHARCSRVQEARPDRPRWFPGGNMSA